MNLNKFSVVLGNRTRVRYVPSHAHGDKNHPDCEDGLVSSIGGTNVFVKFHKSVNRYGFENATAQACSPEDLIIL